MKKPHSLDLNRRTFLKSMGAGAALIAVGSQFGCATGAKQRRGRLVPANRKMNIACIGCGGKGVSDIGGVATENIVALCDVDSRQAAKIFAQYPKVPKFTDYRVMLRALDDQIDGVVISTPDHMHYAPGLMAITMGKHVFIQKPLAHSIGEARELMEAARLHNVVSQMGNQGHAGEGVRLAREWVQGGVIGDVRAVHIWTKKLTIGTYHSGLRERAAAEPVPEGMDWNLWLGTSPERPYSAEYHPKKWRSWWDFGCGALGDIGCHTMDAAFYGLDLGSPQWIQAETAPFSGETVPGWAIITYEFAARGERPPVKLVWYDGGKLPPRPPGLEVARQLDDRNGYYMVGDQGVIYDASEKCSSPRLVPESRMREVKFPPKTIPRVRGGDPHQEWVAACKGGPRPGSSFDYAAPLTEMVLLGNVAIQARGRRIQWDPAKLAVVDAPELGKYIRPAHRKF
jgi:predicted dehydrogenase